MDRGTEKADTEKCGHEGGNPECLHFALQENIKQVEREMDKTFLEWIRVCVKRIMNKGISFFTCDSRAGLSVLVQKFAMFQYRSIF